MLQIYVFYVFFLSLSIIFLIVCLHIFIQEGLQLRDERCFLWFPVLASQRDTKRGIYHTKLYIGKAVGDPKAVKSAGIPPILYRIRVIFFPRKKLRIIYFKGGIASLTLYWMLCKISYVLPIPIHFFVAIKFFFFRKKNLSLQIYIFYVILLLSITIYLKYLFPFLYNYLLH